MKKRGDIWGLVVVGVLVGVGIWMLMPDDVGKDTTKEAGREKSPPQAKDSARTEDVEMPKQTVEANPVAESGTHSIRGYVQTDPARMRDAAKAARTVVTGMDGEQRVYRAESPFREPLDRMVWAAIRPGGMPSGLRSLYARMRHATGTDEAFVAALKRSTIETDDGDSEEVAAMKERTAEMKAELLEWIEEGNSVEDAIARIEEVVRPERLEMHQAKMMVRKFRQEGDAEGARDFINAENERLRAKGLPEMPMPEFAKEYEDGDDENE